MSTDEYLLLHEKVHVLSRALKSGFDAERIYVLSLGSLQACILRSSNTTR